MMLCYNQISVGPPWIKAAMVISRSGDSLCQSEDYESVEGENYLNAMGKLGEAYEKNRIRNYNGKPKQREIKGSVYAELSE